MDEMVAYTDDDEGLHIERICEGLDVAAVGDDGAEEGEMG